MPNGNAAVIPQMKTLKHRFLESFTMPTAAGPTSTKLPITDVYKRIILYISGSATIDAGGADGVLTPESILSLIRKITLVGTSSSRTKVGDIKVGDGAALFNLQQFLRGTPPEYTDPTPITKGSTPDFDFSLPIDLEMPFSSDPRQSLLNTLELTSLYLNIDWGDDSDVFSAGTITALPVTCRISAEEFVDEFSKRQKYSLHQFSFIEQDSSVTSTRLSVRLKRGNLLRGVLIKQFTRAAVYYHTPVETVINNVSLEVNRVIRKSYTFEELQAQNKVDYQMVSVPTGYAFLDLMPEARYDTLIDTGKYDDVDIVFDITGVANSYIRLYPVELIPE